MSRSSYGTEPADVSRTRPARVAPTARRRTGKRTGRKKCPTFPARSRHVARSARPQTRARRTRQTRPAEQETIFRRSKHVHQKTAGLRRHLVAKPLDCKVNLRSYRIHSFARNPSLGRSRHQSTRMRQRAQSLDPHPSSELRRSFPARQTPLSTSAEALLRKTQTPGCTTRRLCSMH